MFDIPGTYAGIRIVALPNWPTVPDGTERRRIDAHPAICWLSRRLGLVGVRLDPFVEIHVPRTREDDPLIDKINGYIYCGVRTYEQMKAALPVRGTV